MGNNTEIKMICVEQQNFSLHKMQENVWENRVWLLYEDGIVLFRENCGNKAKRVIQYRIPSRKIKKFYEQLSQYKFTQNNDGYDGAVWDISCVDETGKKQKIFSGYVDADDIICGFVKMLLKMINNKKGDVIIGEI